MEFVEQLLARMCHYQHGHINSYLKPMLQRDFISMLPSKLTYFSLITLFSFMLSLYFISIIYHAFIPSGVGRDHRARSRSCHTAWVFHVHQTLSYILFGYWYFWHLATPTHPGTFSKYSLIQPFYAHSTCPNHRNNSFFNSST